VLKNKTKNLQDLLQQCQLCLDCKIKITQVHFQLSFHQPTSPCLPQAGQVTKTSPSIRGFITLAEIADVHIRPKIVPQLDLPELADAGPAGTEAKSQCIPNIGHNAHPSLCHWSPYKNL